MTAWDKYHWFSIGFVAAALLWRLTPDPKGRAASEKENSIYPHSCSEDGPVRGCWRCGALLDMDKYR